MPYIDAKIREELKTRRPKTAGELNYTLTLFAIAFFRDNGMNYQAINDVIGALEGAKLEFYRRIAGPYETVKAKFNGDVYETTARAALAAVMPKKEDPKA